jgi:hypothetical protein
MHKNFHLLLENGNGARLQYATPLLAASNYSKYKILPKMKEKDEQIIQNKDHQRYDVSQIT